MATITKNALFDLTATCKDLYLAIKGLGTDKTKLIQVLTTHDNSQRQLIKEKYKFMYDSDLCDDIKGEQGVSGHFLEGLFALLYSPEEYSAICLHESLHLFKSHKFAFLECLKHLTNVRTYVLIEIMISRSYDELQLVQKCYKKLYSTDLDKDITRKMCMSHQFIKLLRTLAAIRRSEDSKVEDKQVVEDAKNLIDSEHLSFINESELIRIFSTRSYPQLSKILVEYSNLSPVGLSDKISNNSDFEKDFKEGLLSIIEISTNVHGYFAIKLNQYLEYYNLLGPKDNSFMHLIISRSEKDLDLIKQKYFQLFNKKLKDVIIDKLVGSFEGLLVAIIKD